jgi:UDP-N-acetylglucosamine 2-epimerase
MEELGKPTNVGFAEVPFPVDHVGGHTTRTEDRQQAGLSEVALFHEVLQDLKRRDFGHFHSIIRTLADRWRRGEFALATVHRAENTDDPERLRAIVSALEKIARTICSVVWPMRPRTRKCLGEMACALEAVAISDPVSYFDMLLLESRARFVLTDSGGVQKEAYFFRVPCITLRDETEWVETLENHCNVLAGPCEEKILEATRAIGTAGPWTAVYGDGSAGMAIVNAIEQGAAR